MKWQLSVIGLFLILVLGTALVYGESTSTVDTVVVTTEQAGLTQVGYRWYSNIDSLTPISPLAAQNDDYSVPSAGEVLRLRMALLAGEDLNSGLSFYLQYSSSTSSGFTNLSTSTTWIFYDNPSVADGQTILTTVLTGSNVGQSYDESNPSTVTPNVIISGEQAEWDWVIKNNSADTGVDWYFRMVFSSGTALGAYNVFPSLSAISTPTSTPTSTPGGGATSISGGGGLIAIGGEPIQPFPPVVLESPCANVLIQRADLNLDCRVDLVDLSILLFYYEERGVAISRYDFNNNSIVDFPDVSVMMFYWTG